MKKFFEVITTLIYLFAATALTLMALSIMAWSVYEVFEIVADFSLKNEFILIMLQSVGAIIIAVAILDVAKYMVEEEVFRNKELRSPKEARETITKIMVIVAIAVSMEGLVYIFKAGTTDITLLIYPASLILVSVIVIVCLGLYQKLSTGVEEKSIDLNG
jgi:hypothetical protein